MLPIELLSPTRNVHSVFATDIALLTSPPNHGSSPHFAMGVSEFFQGFCANLNAVPGSLGQDVMAPRDVDRINKMFVEMVDIFNYSIL